MNFFIFVVYAIAILVSFFVIGIFLGALFIPRKAEKKIFTVSTPPDTHASTITQAPKSDSKNVGKRLRALMFGWEFPPFNSGGLGVACLGLTRALADKNLDITFVMPKKLPLSVPFARMVWAELDKLGFGKPGSDTPSLDIHMVDSPVVPYSQNGSYAKYSDGTPIYGADLIDETRRYARFGALIASREPCDIVYAHDWFSFGAGKAAKRVSGKPFIAHIHSTEFDRSGDNVNQDVYNLEHEGMHGADHVVTVSHRTKDLVASRYGIPHEKVSVVWNGIDDITAPLENSSVTARLSALKDAGYKIVLFMGRITFQKGPDYFVSAARRVAEQDPNVIFVLAGSGDMEYQVIHQAAELGLADKMFFPGFLRGHDQYEAYALADLFVMPSVSEPFGITALEAMRAGTPVIVSKQSGVSEAVTNIMSVDFWDVEKMADMMLSVLESKELHDELSRKGKEEAATMTWERSAHEVRSIINRVIYNHNTA